MATGWFLLGPEELYKISKQVRVKGEAQKQFFILKPFTRIHLKVVGLNGSKL